jgi:leucyl aminopeptidase
LLLQDCYTDTVDQSIPLTPLNEVQLKAWLKDAPNATQHWVEANGFTAKVGHHCALPGDNGGITRVLYGVKNLPDIWTLSDAANQLPFADYRLDCDWSDEAQFQVALGWGLGAYRFTHYKADDTKPARLVVGAAAEQIASQLTALSRVRDLINTPPEDMMPPQLAGVTKKMALQYGATFSEIIGDVLLTENYPAIHAVGRASVHAPRLLRFKWGNQDHPRVALVGKGVCFDSGGLDLKPANGMRLMQKDMGGAAHVLGLAELIMAEKLPVHLDVMIPAVENAVSGNAFHPGDVLETRAGISVEVENTDAEGRLVLCDALAEVCNYEPDLVVDFATLTGAARVAVGTEIGCFFSSDSKMANAICQAGETTHDPVWQLPLHQAYESQIESRVADVLNCSTTPFGGAITAALFLQKFVSPDTFWLHFDVMAWNKRKRPGRPEGGEAMGIRAVFAYLQERYSGL